MAIPFRLNSFISVFLIAGCLLFASFMYWRFSTEEKEISLSIGAGSSNGESFLFAQAIKELIENHHQHISIEILETRGSKENMKLLEEGIIHMATSQADIEAAPSARIISTLYPDLFQLIARKDAGISSVQDLAGKRIALPREGGGQWISFWFLANHYGLSMEDINYISVSGSEGVELMIKGAVDALFSVRAAPNQDIATIIREVPIAFIRISQGEAMRLKQPAMEDASIPMGAYRGNPPTPQQKVPTVAVSRLLVAHKDTDPEAIKIITKELFERRRELLKQTSLAGFIKQPNWSEGTFIPIHPGAAAFFDREKPPYLVENADFFALILSSLLVLFSALVGLRSYWLNIQKNKADFYTKELVQLTNEIRLSEDLEYIYKQKEVLLSILSEVIDDLDKDKVNPEGFNFFSFTWNVAFSIIQEKERLLTNDQA